VVAKHGNKAVSSNSGSADIFSKIGIDLNQDKEKVEQSLTDHNLAFIYAPLYHPALKNVAQARKELGVRTIFNFLGPLLNPAQTDYQLIGCSDKKIAKIMLEVCYLLGKKKCIIVTGLDGMDEISISSDSLIFEMGADQKIKETTFNPEKYGIKKCSKELILGKDPDYNSKQLIKLLKGQIDSKELEAYANIVALNAAMALTLKNNNEDISLIINKVKAKINSGECYSFLQKFTKNIS
jgi:anthranilate phosphoribosyltransferase